MSNGNIKKFFVMVTCLAMVMPQCGFAGEAKPFEVTSGENLVATTAYTPGGGNSDGQTILPSVDVSAQQSFTDLSGNDSALSLPDAGSGGTTQAEPIAVAENPSPVQTDEPSSSLKDGNSGDVPPTDPITIAENPPPVPGNETPISSPGDNSGDAPQTEPITVAENPPPASGNEPLIISPVDNNPGVVPKTLTEAESMTVLLGVNELVKTTLNFMTLYAGQLYAKTGYDFQALNAEIKRFEEARIVLYRFFNMNESSKDRSIKTSSDTSSGDSRATAFETLQKVDKILGGESQATRDKGNASLTPAEKWMRRFTSFVTAIIQAIRKHIVEDGSLPDVRQLLTAELDPAQPQILNRPKNERFSVKGEAPAQVLAVALPKKAVNEKDVFSWMMETIFWLSRYFEGGALLELSSQLDPLIQRHGSMSEQDREPAGSPKIKEISAPAVAVEGLLRNNKQIGQMFTAIGPLNGDLHSEVLPLTEEDARQSLSLLAEALAVAGQTPGLSGSEAEKIAMANFVIINFLKSPTGQGGSSALDMIAEVEKILGSGSSIANALANSSLDRPEELVQELARCVVSSVQTAHRNLKDGSMLEARQFSAAESDLAQSGHTVLSGDPGHENGNSFRVIDSVVLSRENARTSALLDPSHQLHPFIRWLLYGRHLTQVRAEGYLAEQAKVKEIYLRAKAGEGLIRYKGKVMERFLPLPGDENGGAFELVRRV